MTKFLASVSNPDEAVSVLTAGADIIDIKDPRRGALGAVNIELTKEIVRQISGQVMISATIGDLPMVADKISGAINTMHTTGVDIIKVGIFTSSVPAEIFQVIKHHTKSGCRIVLVFFADLKPELQDFSVLSEAGIYGIMLDTADKTKGSLRTIMNNDELDEFVKQAQSSGLLTGLAGSLKLVDIQPLLKLRPDYLGFRSALCDKQQRTESIDLRDVRNVRALIPIHHYDEYKYQNIMASAN